MKKLTLLLVLALSLICTAAVSAEDGHFSCDSDLSKFNGKTFDNLYLDLQGCGSSFTDPEHPGQISVTFEDLTVTGSIIYNGGADPDDHFIALKNAGVRHILVPCRDTHRCTISFGIDSGITEITLLPSGKDKGRIILDAQGDPETSHVPVVERVNVITGKLTEPVLAGLRPPAALTAGMDLPAYVNNAGGDAEVEFNDLTIFELSVVNEDPRITPSFSFRDYCCVFLMTAWTPKVKIYRPEASDQTGVVMALFTAVDGTAFDLSIDTVVLMNLHFLGNNNRNSVLNLKDAYEKLHFTNYINNVFVFGGNVSLQGYVLPKRGTPTIRRLVYTVQPDAYALEMSPAMMNRLVEDYAEIAENAPEDGRYLLYSNFGEVPYDRLVMGLTQKFARDWPEIKLDWRPAVKLSFVNLMYANVVDSIRDQVPQMNMFLIQNNSFMTGSRNVTRYGWSGELNAYSNDPIHVDEIQAILDELPDGCYTFGFDQYGRVVLR